MPDLSLIELVLLAAMTLVGVIAGWMLRAGRCTREKQAINAGWTDQIAAQKSEHHRLADQNKSLMEQVAQFQASRKDSDLRAKELSESLREAFARRDELQRQLKDIRNNLESAIAERNRLLNDADDRAARQVATNRDVRDREDKIARLSRELENWQSRLPPLIERYRTRDIEAQQLEAELGQARERIADLENLLNSGQTRIEASDSAPLANGLDASNEQYDVTSEHDVSRIDATADGASSDEPDADPGELSGFVDALLPDETDMAGEPEDSMTVDSDAADVFAEDSSGDDTHIDVALDDSLTSDKLDFELPAADPAGDRDDLQKIKGVGPAIEKTLNELGIFRYEQIATLSEFEIDRVARQLKGFRSRIYREDWIGQARMLQQHATPDRG
jgi:predicted flap endonuclease-1-like 5' DNA nuclease/regulator of replication initiation timing